MRRTIFIGAAFAATPAFADPGHIGHLAGHDHWMAAAALTLAAVLLAVLFRDEFRKRREKKRGLAVRRRKV
jgi:membrane protein implicated in regulation of membrane protease activity